MTGKSWLAAFLLSGLAVTAQAQAGEPKWGPSLELLAKPGNERTLGEIDVFAPLWQDDRSMVFGNARGQGDTDDNLEGNIGLGYRAIFNDRWIVGGYGYFDYRRSENDNGFIQGTFGAEALSVDWDFRVNAYIPEGGSERADDRTRAEVVGTQLFVREGRERALYGVNAEAGWRLPIEAAEVRLYAGGYWFDAEDVDAVAGPRGRLEVRFDDSDFLPSGARVTVGVEAQWDEPRGSQVFAIARLRIPLGGKARRDRWSTLSALERRMVERVERDVDIVVQGANTPREPATIGGLVVSSVQRVGPGGDLEDVVETVSGSNGLVIVDGLVIENDAVDLQSGQVLLGGGTSLVVAGATSGARTTFTAPGAAGTISNTTGLNDVVRLANDAMVRGLTIQGGQFGVFGGNVDNTELSGVTVENVNRGIGVIGNGTSLSDVTVTNSAGTGIGLNGNNASLRNVSVADVGGTGVGLNGNNPKVSNLTVTNTGGTGILVNANNARLEAVTVTNAGVDGIGLNGAGNASLTNVTINRPADDGIQFNGVVDSPTGSGNTVTDQGGLVCNNLGMVINSTLIVNGQPCP